MQSNYGINSNLYYCCKKKLNTAITEIQDSEWSGWSALIRYFFCEDADMLDDDIYVQRIAELQFCLSKMGMLQKTRGF